MNVIGLALLGLIAIIVIVGFLLHSWAVSRRTYLDLWHRDWKRNHPDLKDRWQKRRVK